MICVSRIWANQKHLGIQPAAFSRPAKRQVLGLIKPTDSRL